MFPADFHFLRPFWWLALPPLALLLLRLWTAHGQQRSPWQGLCDPELLTKPTGGRSSMPLLLLQTSPFWTEK